MGIKKIKSTMDLISLFLKRNKIILFFKSRPALKNSVNLNWWKMPQDLQNVGDYLSPVVVNYMKERNGIKSDRAKKTCHLYAIGSILQAGYQDATIWGSGFLSGHPKYWWKKVRKLDVRCVRGPLTRELLLSNNYNCLESYGDPALLMPLIYMPENKDKKYSYRIVRHYAYSDNNEEVCISPLVTDWKNFIDEIVQSELIISSSLHGVILAEAYGVPAILLKEDKMNLFKYRDYYLSTNRKEIPIAESIEEALKMTRPTVPDITALQDGLLKSFPLDLWIDKEK